MDFERLKKKRAALRANTTRLINKLEIETNNSDPEIDLIEEFIAQLTAKEKDLILLDAEIEPFIEIENWQDEVNANEDYKEKILIWKTRANRILKNSNRNESTLSIRNEITHPDSSCNASSRVKLPDIPLPIFAGQYEEWSNFKTQFVNIIVNNSQLSEVEKLHYLKCSLRGIAKQVETEDDSFQSLFKALEDRFENKRLIIDRHINFILKIETIHSESATELRNLIDNLNKNIRALKHWNIERSPFSDILLINTILPKLDRESRRQFEFGLETTEVPEWTKFMAFLEKCCQVLENIGRTVYTKPRIVIQHPNKTKSFLIDSRASSTFNSCKLCNAQHPLYKCETFINLEVRKRFETVKKLGLCINCLKTHKVAACKSNGACAVCKRRHHSLLHYENKSISSVAQLNKNELGDTLQNRSPPDAHPPLGEGVSDAQFAGTAVIRDERNKSVLLSTAVVYLRNGNGKSFPFRALIDNGSMCNFVSTECAKLLNLKQEKINVEVSCLTNKSLTIRTKIG